MLLLMSSKPLVQSRRWPARRSVLEEITEAVRHRDLLTLLIQKDLKVKYKGTALCFVWSLLNPMLMMLVYAVVFSVIARFPIQRYPVFLLSGLLPWNAFTAAVSSASTSLIANANLVRRVRFPLEFLPLTAVLSGVVNLLLSLVILVIFALAFRQPLGLPLITLPLLLVMQVLFTTGVCLLLSALDVYFRDVEYLVGIGLTALFFLSPVIYPLSSVSGNRLAIFLQLNPMTWLVTSYQAIWHDNSWPRLDYVGAFAVAAVVMMLFGRYVFRRLEGRFAEEV